MDFNSGGFGGHDDDDLGALIASTRQQYTQPATSPSADDEGFNPFADMQSSYTAQPISTSTFAYDHEEVETPRRFERESAPEPETPIVVHTSVYQPDEQDPFAQFRAPSPSPPQPLESQYYEEELDIPPAAAKPDLSDLFGEEKPILPSFSTKRREASTFSDSNSPIYVPGKKKAVGRSLAALFDQPTSIEDEEEEEPDSPLPDKTFAIDHVVTPSALVADPQKPSVEAIDVAFSTLTVSQPTPTESTSVTPDKSEPQSLGYKTFNPTLHPGKDGSIDDADSMRGTYSRSFVEEDNDKPSTSQQQSSSPPLPSVPVTESPPQDMSNPTQTVVPPQLPPTFVITVEDPQKVGSSLNVTAQHTLYTVRTKTTATSFRKPEFSVLRRYSHFLWLFDTLTLNNPGVIVPGMPEKNVMGRFDSDFIENRRNALQATLMKIVAHPMLVGDPDLRLFLESDTFTYDIKQRKIDSNAESKGLLAAIGSTLTGPRFYEFDEYFDHRKEMLETFESQLKTLLFSFQSVQKARQSLHSSLLELSASLSLLAENDLSPLLRSVIEKCAIVQRRVADIVEKEGREREVVGGFVAVLEGYLRLCKSVKHVFGARIKAYHQWQAAENNLRKVQQSHEKAKRNGRQSDLVGFSVGDLTDAERKNLDAREDFEDVTKLTKAEMARFDAEKISDIREALAFWAEGMVERQSQIVSLWTDYHTIVVEAANKNLGTSAATTQPPQVPVEATP